MNTEVVRDRAGFERLSGEWNELLKCSPADTLFLTWEWISAWLDVVRPEADLLIIVGRLPDGKLGLLAPFYHARLHFLKTLPYQCLRILGDYGSGSEYPDIIIRQGLDQEGLTCVVKTLLEETREWDCLWVPNIAGWTGAPSRWTNVLDDGRLLRHKRPMLFSAIRLPPTHEEYLSLLSHKRRGNVRRDTRRLEKEHDAVLIQCQKPTQLPGLLEALFDLHRKHWESAGEPSAFIKQPAMRRFYERVAPVALERGLLGLYGLQVDGVICAAQFGYIYNNSYLAVQEGYDPELDGAGTVLRNLVIKNCIEKGVREYDFLGGFTPHKKLWGAEPRKGWSLFAGRRTLSNRLLFVPRFMVWPQGQYPRPEEVP